MHRSYKCSKFPQKNVGDLRQIVMTTYLKDGEIYNPKLHYDLEWIRMIFNKL